MFLARIYRVVHFINISKVENVMKVPCKNNPRVVHGYVKGRRVFDKKSMSTRDVIEDAY